MREKFKVHVLPTKEYPALLCSVGHVEAFGEKQEKWYGWYDCAIRTPHSLNHLYFTTDEEIKVIATTNPDLWNKLEDGTDMGNKTRYFVKGVAKIPTDFIEAFVREQGIWEVLLEMELTTPQGKIVSNETIAEVYAVKQSDIGEDYTEAYNKKLEELGGAERIPQPKLRPNGEVVWHPVKERMYTRETFLKGIMAFNKWRKEEKDLGIYEPAKIVDWFNKNYPE